MGCCLPISVYFARVTDSSDLCTSFFQTPLIHFIFVLLVFLTLSSFFRFVSYFLYFFFSTLYLLTYRT